MVVVFRLMKKESLSVRAVTLFERMAPLLRVIESVVPPQVGLSIVAVGEK